MCERTRILEQSILCSIILFLKLNTLNLANVILFRISFFVTPFRPIAKVMFERELRSSTCYCTSLNIRPFLFYIEMSEIGQEPTKSSRPPLENGYPSLLYLFCFSPTRIYPSIYPSTSPLPRSPFYRLPHDFR